MTQYVFGFGSGRCGTASLANLLDSQEKAYFGHEGMPLHWWHMLADYEAAKNLIIEGGKDNDYAGNIAYYWLPYTTQLVKDFPGVKFIYLWRDKEEVVESFWKRNLNRIEMKEYPPNLWWSSYPFMRNPPTKDAIADMWDMYYAMAQVVMINYPSQTFITKMENLNDMEKMSKLLSFVGIPEDKQVLKECRDNVAGQVKLGFFNYIKPQASNTDVLESERFKEILK